MAEKKSSTTQKPAKAADAPKKTKAPVSGQTGQKMIAVIRVRGLTGIKIVHEDTLKMLHLYKKNFCTVRLATPSIVGMIKKVKDFVTYGDIDEETMKLLESKKAPALQNGKDRLFYRLNSPRKGFGRKGIKQPFSKQGALGYRGDKINDLIKRML